MSSETKDGITATGGDVSAKRDLRRILLRQLTFRSECAESEYTKKRYFRVSGAPAVGSITSISPIVKPDRLTHLGPVADVRSLLQSAR